MEKDTIITLDNNKDYALLDETELAGRKFFYAVRVNEKEEPLQEFEIFEEINENGETFIEIVPDGDEKKALVKDFTFNYMHEVGDLMDKQAGIN